MARYYYKKYTKMPNGETQVRVRSGIEVFLINLITLPFKIIYYSIKYFILACYYVTIYPLIYIFKGIFKLFSKLFTSIVEIIEKKKKDNI